MIKKFTIFTFIFCGSLITVESWASGKKALDRRFAHSNPYSALIVDGRGCDEVDVARLPKPKVKVPKPKKEKPCEIELIHLIATIVPSTPKIKRNTESYTEYDENSYFSSLSSLKRERAYARERQNNARLAHLSKHKSEIRGVELRGTSNRTTRYENAVKKHLIRQGVLKPEVQAASIDEEAL